MYNRRLMILIIALGFALWLLIWNWNMSSGINLNASTGTVSSGRWEMDLTGQWEIYPSLRQAWVTESEKETQNSSHRLTEGSPGYLPSSREFHVATKTFRVPAEWNARTLILELNGVRGQLAVYLNGIESTNRIGTLASEGGTERLEIPIKALQHGQDNLLLFELSAPPSQEQTLLGFRYPVKGQITGYISLQAVMETTLENPKLQVSWDKDAAKLNVSFHLLHHGFLEYGPWTIQGVLSDGSAEVAQAELRVDSDENQIQPVTLSFDIPNGRRWSTEDPFLYQLYLTVTNPKGDKDNLAFPVALSSISFEKSVFKENGEVFPIKGFVLSPSQEFRAREEGDVQQQIREYKDKGYNLLYFVGGYPDELWLENADQLGMGIWAELPGNAMIPYKRFPQPQIWENLIRDGSLHPSLWAYTFGKGLEVNPQAFLSEYNKEVQNSTKPIPAFNVQITNQQVSQHGSTFDEGKIRGTWGEVEFQNEDLVVHGKQWPQEKWVSGIWVIIVILVAWLNLIAPNWRYKELKTKKPKRALRRAWFWNGVALITREMTLAAVITTFVLNLSPFWSSLIPNQWPLWEGLKQQSPWLIWFLLGLLFTLARLLQVGIVAPHMPETPAPVGLALWLERRYLWIWVVALLWAAYPWGIPRYIPILVYMGLSILFLPLKIRDVHRVGGKYASFFLAPSILVVTFGIMSLFRWEDILYLFHLVQGIAFK